jgi:general L-amino acid transport system permease protein
MPSPELKMSWSNSSVRAAVFQTIALGLVGWVAWFLVSNTLTNLAARNIATGFSFLHREAGFAIGESVLKQTPADSYAWIICAGILNTLRVAVAAIVLSTVIGTIIGIGRLSTNWLIARLTSVYVEVMRNIPLLLQLFFWYALITESMPGPRQSHRPLPGVYLSNRGLMVPGLEGASLDWVLGGLGIALAAGLVMAHQSARRRERTGKGLPTAIATTVMLVAFPWVGWLLGGAALQLDIPRLAGFDFAGGLGLSPEFTALLIGLVTYNAAFVAEVVRSGIQSVGAGQSEAGRSIGMRRGLVLRLVVLPQALRVMIPSLTNQYLSLIKNSSLAVAIGYPDIVGVLNTTITQTGQAIEGILIVMAVYLSMSLSVSLFMNWYNGRMALVER